MQYTFTALLNLPARARLLLLRLPRPLPRTGPLLLPGASRRALRGRGRVPVVGVLERLDV